MHHFDEAIKSIKLLPETDIEVEEHLLQLTNNSSPIGWYRWSPNTAFFEYWGRWSSRSPIFLPNIYIGPTCQITFFYFLSSFSLAGCFFPAAPHPASTFPPLALPSAAALLLHFTAASQGSPLSSAQPSSHSPPPACGPPHPPLPGPPRPRGLRWLPAHPHPTPALSSSPLLPYLRRRQTRCRAEASSSPAAARARKCSDPRAGHMHTILAHTVVQTPGLPSSLEDGDHGGLVWAVCREQEK